MSNIRIGDLVEVRLSHTMSEEVWVGTRFRVSALPKGSRGLYSGPMVRASPHPDFHREVTLDEGDILHFFAQDIRRVGGRFGDWYKEHS